MKARECQIGFKKYDAPARPGLQSSKPNLRSGLYTITEVPPGGTRPPPLHETANKPAVTSDTQQQAQKRRPGNRCSTPCGATVSFTTEILPICPIFNSADQQTASPAKNSVHRVYLSEQGRTLCMSCSLGLDPPCEHCYSKNTTLVNR